MRLATSPIPSSTDKLPRLHARAPALMSTSRSTWGFGRGEEVAGHRTVQALLGGGRRFEAYAVWNHRRMVPTVLKVLRPALAQSARDRNSMRREGVLLDRLRHPGLTRLLDMDPQAEHPFIEMEYVAGVRLSTLLRRRGRLSPDAAVALGRQVATTLDYLHGEGVLHLDVKPSNIIVGPTPRLIDLSVARPVERAARIDGLVGTDAYMAPEQADPRLWATIGPKSDTWGLGATLYHATAGRIPHSRGRRDATGSERFPQLAESPASLAAAAGSSGLVAAVMDSLRRVPEERPTVAELRDRLTRLESTTEA